MDAVAVYRKKEPAAAIRVGFLVFFGRPQSRRDFVFIRAIIVCKSKKKHTCNNTVFILRGSSYMSEI